MAQTIRTFVNSTRLWHRLFQGGANLAFQALVLGVALLVLDVFWPGVYWTAVWIVAGWLALVLAFHALRRGASLRAADQTLGLRDQLVTWWELRGQPAQAVNQWLEDDLERMLRDLPPASRSPLWRRSARRLWWMLPALLLVWWIGPLGHHFGMHSVTGDSRQASAGAPRAEDSKGGPGNGARSRSPEPGEREARSKSSPPPERSQPREQPEVPPSQPAAALPPPRPLHTLKAKDEFIIPRYLGDGDGVTRRMKVAVLEEGAGARAQGRRTQDAAKVAQDNRRLEFEAAAEQARRARHVPVSERAFVKRYFQALLEERR